MLKPGKRTIIDYRYSYVERAAGLEPAKVCLEGRCNSHYAMLAYCNNKNWKDYFRVITFTKSA